MSIFYSTRALPKFRRPVITMGTFDGVHLGHKIILEQVVSHATVANGESVVITFEPHPRKLIFPDDPLKLITPLDNKLELIRASGIDHVVVAPFSREFSNLTAEQYIRQFLVALFRPIKIVIGYDHHFGRDRKGNIQMLKQWESEFGYSVIEIPAHLIDEAAVSSTKIRHAIVEGRVQEAAHMLGRNYTLSGSVIKGAQLGRSLGYPTANLHPDDADQLIPQNGIYAAWVVHNGTAYRGMASIGFNPTVSNEQKLHIEAHLLDFDKDIYGESIEISFVKRLRGEIKFASLALLMRQMDNDRDETNEILSAMAKY